ncbi:MAG: hypothetical protein J2P54_24125 [Bradyrhizobiaceae bacterium]|nr:hypothetical protein [Bradyrhizobiaceae bacterium]
MSYRQLNASDIVKTIRILEQRIRERFPGSGLAAVCHELGEVGETTQRRARAIAVPNLWLRTLIYVSIIAGVVGLAYTVRILTQSTNLQVGTEVFGFFQGIDALMHIVVVVGAALFFAISLDDRIKRRYALSDLHVFRSIAHVIDMHQLTKDPSIVLGHYHATTTSPKRVMNRFELTRYLDYCSEMLSLTGKLAALYAQSMPDSVVIDAVNDIESLAANLSAKIWQKITILDSLEEKAGSKALDLKERAPG